LGGHFQGAEGGFGQATYSPTAKSLYLATLAVGDFGITHSRTRTRTGIPVINAYSTDLPVATAARPLCAQRHRAPLVGDADPGLLRAGPPVVGP
jgi:hypothetical protein